MGSTQDEAMPLSNDYVTSPLPNDFGDYQFPTNRLKRSLEDPSKTPLVLVACGSFSPYVPQSCVFPPAAWFGGCKACKTVPISITQTWVTIQSFSWKLPLTLYCEQAHVSPYVVPKNVIPLDHSFQRLILILQWCRPQDV